MDITGTIALMNQFKEILKFTIIALIIVIPVRTFIAQPFIVSGSSMDPTFATGQYLIIDQVSYRLSDPKRNDVIVFRYPRNPKIFYIKRIIGLPTETISINTGKVTIINKENPEGMLLPDPYIAPSHHSSETLEVTLGSAEYFVMGDNRTESSDSRLWGALPAKYIMGRPLLRLLPLSKISILPGRN
ncbi:MAG: signal peptidase I [Candidatus Taylorbacteria bacterium]|nr:signal peptidase I [Candidatus Taylorbacteria bacterium]